jgi:hypothetical protein
MPRHLGQVSATHHCCRLADLEKGTSPFSGRRIERRLRYCYPPEKLVRDVPQESEYAPTAGNRVGYTPTNYRSGADFNARTAGYAQQQEASAGKVKPKYDGAAPPFGHAHGQPVPIPGSDLNLHAVKHCSCYSDPRCWRSACLRAPNAKAITIADVLQYCSAGWRMKHQTCLMRLPIPGTFREWRR